jgi:hypothetical protein
VVFHGYGFQLDWSRMAERVAKVYDVFSIFRAALADYMEALAD